LAAGAALPAARTGLGARCRLGGGFGRVAQPQCLGSDDGGHVRDVRRGRRLLGGERLAAAFEALAAGWVHRQHGPHRSVQLLDFGADGLVGHEHGQSQANGDRQHGHNRGRSDLVSKRIAYTSGEDAHCTPWDHTPGDWPASDPTLVPAAVQETG
jgi:hypothetical protein